MDESVYYLSALALLPNTMCLIALAYHCHPEYPLLVAANRDEYYHRPTAAAHFWEDRPELLAGRDLLAAFQALLVAAAGAFFFGSIQVDLQGCFG